MQINELREGDRILLRVSGRYVHVYICKVAGGVTDYNTDNVQECKVFYKLYKDDREVFKLDSLDKWVLDNEEKKPSIFSDSDKKFLERFVLVSLVCAGAVILGTLLSKFS